MLGVGLPGFGRAAEEPQKYGGDGMPNGLRDSPKIFVSIAPDGIGQHHLHRSEMGQGVRTSLPRIVADELEADYKRVRVVQAPGDEAKYGNQDTDGSRSTRHWFEPMRRCGAAARQMLEQAAANQWSVPLDEVEARNHEVVHKTSGRKLGYGALAVAAAKLDVPARDVAEAEESVEVPLHRQERHRRSPTGRSSSTASRSTASTRACPACCTRSIARPPVLGGKVQELRRRRGDEGARRRQGVRDRGHAAAVGVHAGRRRGRRRQGHLGGDQGPQGAQDRLGRRRRTAATTRRASAAELEAAVKKPGGKVVRNDGDAYAALAERGEEARGGLLRAALRARDDGVPGRHRAHRRRRLRGLGAEPVAAGGARPRRQAARTCRPRR